jgi:LETM1 and EF-hand domain-containing protein 1
VGLTSFGYKRNLKEWLDLSIQKHIPISLLIISRAIALSSTSVHPEDVLKSSMQALDQGIINEVVLAAASPSEKNTLDMKARKLESIQFQKERIDEERVKSDVKPDKKSDTDVVKEPKVSKEEKATKEAEDVVDPTPSEVGYTIMPTEEIVFTPESVASTIKDLEITGTREIKDSNISKPDDVLKPVKYDDTLDKIPPISVEEKKEEKKQAEKAEKITLSELEAIGDLTRESSVEREKAELAILEASIDSVIIESKEKKIKINKSDILETPTHVQDDKISEVEEKVIDKKPLEKGISSTTDDKKIKEAEDEEIVIEEEVEDEDSDQTDDKSLANMKHVLGNMLHKLKVKIDTTDKELGQKLHLLDIDNDGELSSGELKEAFTKILKRLPNEEEIIEMIDTIDLDKDGKVSVLELLQYVEERRKIDEFQNLEV